METRRVILTGATGFVGANLARRLLREGHELHLLVRKNCRTWRIEALRRKVKLHEVELGDMDRLGRVVGRIRPHWIFHLAAYGAYPSQNDFHKMIQTNFIETVSMVEACLKAGFESFIHFGSSSEYGFKDHAPSEKEGIDPNSFYAVTKASATLFCRYAARSRDARIITLRLYSVYGPWEEPTRLIPTLIIRGLNGELPPLVDPDVARDYVYVDDVTEACLRAVCATDREPGAVYNIGTGIQTSIRSVVETARRTMRIPAMPRWGSMRNREWDTTVWMADISSSLKRLGWRPRHTFQEGFRKTLAWFRTNPDVLEFYRTFGDSPGRD